MSESFIELRNIRKEFSGMVALDDVSLNIRKGEIHCLAGENGSGKSTLIKVMSGVYQPNGGEIWIDGKPVGKLSPIESIDHGIQVIYQDFSLFGNLTVAENLAMNVQLREKKKILNWKRVRQIATEAVHRLGVNLDLDTEVEKLPTAGKQLVAIARALMSDARLIIMDEPTTALTGKEVETLFRIVRDIQARGIAILFVSHKMREMLEISEHITVIRNGSKVADGPTSDFDEALISRHMTGTDITTEPYVWTAPADTTTTPPRIEARGLTVDGHFEDIDLNIHAGEIVGLSGLLGSGRTELVLALFGMLPGYQGKILVDGVETKLSSPQDAIAAGVAYVPEDRLSEGLFLTQGIDRNMLSTSYERLAPSMIIDRKRADTLVDKMIAEMQIATTSGKKMVNELSGGNQQRVVLARWLLTDARVLILNGPTVGVDVGSKAEIHRKIRELSVQKGLAVLMISDDVPELIQNCNRIIMMHRGRFTDEMACAETSDGQISSLLRTLK
ncbi:MAG: lipase [Thalassospira sp.]|uniref:sugar ABC transporter ATP-binding protein n=1 Tax=Thalassospira sp. GB04J01 TaxID=1485225 RepID=UPI000C0CDCF6|nr:sugar ABC transporter ATP-binding protein [Thalassospira sp. GB04J01]MBV16264.1 lipase [Thalassospira sp.]|tara:strand:+ start:16190 stop:17695 length:1506 start_codon:yes stop_codon:yes gene_type:complete